MESTDLSNLPGLRFLDLSDNRLASIHGLERCTSLLELSLAENRIARVGRGVSGCPRLQKVVLDGNLIINCKVSGQPHTLAVCNIARIYP